MTTIDVFGRRRLKYIYFFPELRKPEALGDSVFLSLR